MALKYICSDLLTVQTHLADFTRCEIPNLNEAINGSCDQVLAIRGEPCTLHMGLWTKL